MFPAGGIVQYRSKKAAVVISFVIYLSELQILYSNSIMLFSAIFAQSQHKPLSLFLPPSAPNHNISLTLSTWFLPSLLFYFQNLPCFFKGTEWTCTKKRMLAGIITDYAFGLGYMLLAGIAYLIRDWRKLQLAISAPGFLLIFYIWWEKFSRHLNIRSTVYISDSFSCLCPLFLLPLLSLSALSISC